MKRRLQYFSMGSSSHILAKRLLPSITETFRTHVWSLLPRRTVPFSSMANPLEFVDGGEIEVRRPLKPISISISNKNQHLLPFLKDQDISSKGLLSAKVETFRTHDWPLLLKYNVPFSPMGYTPEFFDDEEIDGGGRLKPISISDKDLQLPSFLNDRHFSALLLMLLPYTDEKLKTEDWSLLLKFSSMDSKLNSEDALKSELAAFCVWFLFNEVPPHVKVGVARTLTFISLGTSKVTKISVNQMDIENLVVRILRSGNTEAQRQVCLALSVLGCCPSRRSAVKSGDGIQDQLLDLVCNSSDNPDSTYHVLRAFVSVCLVGKGMREKISETELLHSWLVKLLSRKDDESIMVDAIKTVAYIAGERCDCELWDHVKEKLLPPIINGVCCMRSSLYLLQVIAYAISKITKYASSDQINDVVEMGGLEFLVNACSRDEEDRYLLEKCFDAIDNILRVGEAKAKAKAKAKGEGYYEEEFVENEEDKVVKSENEYANMIDEYWYSKDDGDFDGWEILLLKWSVKDYDHPIVRKAEHLVHKYRPHLEREPIY